LNEWQLANLAVGLEEIKTTTFHLALVSAAIGQNGTIYSPYMIKNVKNVLQLGFYNHSSRVMPLSKKDSTHFIKIKEAMIQVVADRRGTAYRSKVDFIPVAAKTGTAGNKRNGFDAVIMGFFPARQARYSFAFRLERGGKAQVEGAAFLKKFITTCFKSRK
jgi:cell division protein FtsI/penicillin-binding protein 2